MPAASEPGSAPRGGDHGLPRTYRPLGPRIAGLVAMGALLAVGAATWFTFDDATRATFTPFQRGTLVALILLAGSAMWALVRSRAVAEHDRLVVINGYRRHEYAWEQILAINLGVGAPWVTLDLSDGRSVAVMGIQGSDGVRARTAVRELRELAGG